jgi:hypothetical protein
MDVRHALKEQYRAGLAMLAECVQKCPDDLWTTPSTPNDDGDRIIYRSFWRIAFHTAYFTHLYLGQNDDAFEPWPGRKQGYYDEMWQKPWDIEPYEFPEDAQVTSKQEILDYISFVDSLIDPTVSQLDLDSPESGFAWYKKIGKLSHELMNLRHLQGHVGQLSELLMTRGVETGWVSRGALED